MGPSQEASSPWVAMAIPTRLAPKVTSATPIGRFNDFVEMAREASREEGLERSLSFDLDKRWS